MSGRAFNDDVQRRPLVLAGGAAVAATPQPASAAAAVAGLLTGPIRDGAVLGALTEAVIIGVPTEHGARVACLLTSRASGVPNGVRVAGVSAWGGQRAGDRVQLGAGHLRTGAADITIVRTWPSAVHPIRVPRDGLAALTEAAGSAERGVPVAVIECLRRAVSRQWGGHPDAVAPAVEALIGLGQGLTPGGDDVVAGLLIGLHATGRPDLAHRIGAIDRWSDRTTLLSADLLRLAASGHACLEVLAVLSALHAGGPLGGPIDRLLSVGHTSGADLATGLAIGLQRSCPAGFVRHDARASRQEAR